jgi:hypothetical protein
MTPGNRRKYGCLSLGYFTKAVSRARAAYPRLPVFVFSNAEASTSFEQIGRHDRIVGKSTLEDFIRMSTCTVHIISNSTFSWWAAALAQAEAVFAPAPWAIAKSLQPSRIVPPSWNCLVAEYE